LHIKAQLVLGIVQSSNLALTIFAKDLWFEACFGSAAKPWVDMKLMNGTCSSAKLCTFAGLSCNDLSQMCSLSQQLTPFLDPQGLQSSKFHTLPDTVQW